jgi:hypothetical protein
MSEINNLDCEQAREELDLLLEASVQARIESKLGAKAGGIIESGADENSAGQPTQALRHHLGQCQACHNYQLANRVIIEAAREMPKLTADSALTSSIMAMIDLEIAAQALPEESVDAAGAKKQLLLFDGKSMAILAASFAAFIVLSSGFSADGLWSAFSWLVALAMVALLKPLLEQNQYPNNKYLQNDRMVKA